MPFPESKGLRIRGIILTTIIVVGQPVATVQRSIIDLSGICSLYRLKAAPQIHNFIPSKTTVTRYKNIENVML